MDFRVEITEPAIADLKEIVVCIAQHNPRAAAALGNNLLDAALSLGRIHTKAALTGRSPASGNSRFVLSKSFTASATIAPLSKSCASGIQRDVNQSSDSASMKTNLVKRRIKAPKRSSCALCKPHKRGWEDKKNPGELRTAVKHSQELREHGFAG
jgi:plasmid stabilization system protein ParE